MTLVLYIPIEKHKSFHKKKNKKNCEALVPSSFTPQKGVILLHHPNKSQKSAFLNSSFQLSTFCFLFSDLDVNSLLNALQTQFEFDMTALRLSLCH
ncbi:hypothetical protein ACOSQ2_010077 [Xanthoceras sorbifolium]